MPVDILQHRVNDQLRHLILRHAVLHLDEIKDVSGIQHVLHRNIVLCMRDFLGQRHRVQSALEQIPDIL